MPLALEYLAMPEISRFLGILIEIIHAEYLGDYRMYLAFNDGRAGEADLHALINDQPQSVFAAFADEAFVRQFSLLHGTLCWPGERDVAAEFLYFLVLRDDPALEPKFRQWGYFLEEAA